MTEGNKNDHPPAVPLIRPPNVNLERAANWLGTRPTWSGKGWLDICEQEWLDAFKILGGVPDWPKFVGGRDNWSRLMQGFEMPELEKKIVDLIRSTLEAGTAGTLTDNPEPPAPAAAPVAAPTVVATAPAAPEVRPQPELTPTTPPEPAPSPATTGAFATNVTLEGESPSSSGATRSRAGTGAGLAGTAAAAFAADALAGAVPQAAYQHSPSAHVPPAMVATAPAAQNTSAPPLGIANTPPPAAPALTAPAQPSLSEQSTATRPDFTPVVQACANLIGTTAHGIVSTGWSAVCSLIDPSCGGGQSFDTTCKQVFDATKATGEALYSFFQATRQYHAQRNATQLARAR